MKWPEPVAVLDFETTGTDPDHGEIIQVGLIRWDPTGEHPFGSYVHTEQIIPPFVTHLTGIQQKDVAAAPSAEEVVNHLLPLLDGAALVGHQIAFDRAFLNRMLDRCGYPAFSGPVYDTLDLSQALLPGLPSYALESLSERLGLNHDAPHQALSDAWATLRLFQQLLEHLNRLPVVSLQQVVRLTDGAHWPLRSFFQKAIEANFGQTAEHSSTFVMGGMAVDAPVWLHEQADPPEPTEEPIAPQEVDAVLGPEGSLAQMVQGFEERVQQRQVAQQVTRALNDGSHLLAEAGTGTGKSLAYLVPSLLWAVRNHDRVVVSTYTLTLQQQLLDVDLPLLSKALPVPFRATKMVGRGNFVCLRKVEEALADPAAFSADERIFLAKLSLMIASTEKLEREGIGFRPEEQRFWPDFAADVESCTHRHCPWFSRCYVYRERSLAQEADLVIANHALVLSDQAAESRLLPPYRNIIFDEAHHLDEVATKQFGTTLREESYQRLLRRCNDELASASQREKGELGEAMATLKDPFNRLQEASAVFFAELRTVATSLHFENGAVRLTAQRMTSDRIGTLAETARSTTAILQELDDAVTRLLLLVEGEDSDANRMARLVGPLRRLIAAAKTLGLFADASDAWKEGKEPADQTLWIEVDHEAARHGGPARIVLNSAPTDVAQLLSNSLFRAKRAVILTSATLTVADSFAFLRERLGLNLQEDKPLELSVASPFHYSSQALVLVPTDMVTVKEKETVFAAAAAESLAEVVKALDGRTLVLCTSYQMEHAVYQRLQRQLSDVGITVLGQGIDGSRNRLVRQFTRNPRAVLIGTNTFWEGIDIPGPTLSCVAILRLPFPTPNDPVLEARSERLGQEGGNPFLALTVPQAVLRFKQGFGRLIRTAADRGAVIVYDRRIVDASYGRLFLQALPPAAVRLVHSRDLAEEVRQWVTTSATGQPT